MRGEHIIMRGVVNSSRICNPLPQEYSGRKVRAVWLLLDEADFMASQDAVHFRNAFLDDLMHDWNQEKNGGIRYHAHSSAAGDVVDIIVFFEAPQ